MGTITVVNRHRHTGPGIYIGRGSTFGNPFPIGQQYTRATCLEAYESWFRERFRQSPDFRAELASLTRQYLDGEDLVFICFCKPLACHGDILKRAILALAPKLEAKR